MPFDALTLAAVRQELQQKLVGGRVQNVVIPGPLAVSLGVYRAGVGRAHLLLSAHSQHARIYLTSSAPSRDPEQHPPLQLLLRKYVRGGTLVGVAQPRFERVLVLSIAKRIPPDKRQEYHSEGDFMDRTRAWRRQLAQEREQTADERRRTEDEGLRTEGDEPPKNTNYALRTTDDEEEFEEDLGAPVTTMELVVEVMGRVSNIVLVEEDGTVIDSIKRIPPAINRYRTILPHHPYVAPPPQDKRDPMRTTINAMSLEIAKAAEEDENAPTWKGLVGGYAAVSPTLAREVAFRALGDTRTKAAEVARQPTLLGRVLEEMQALFGMEERGDWQPTVAWKENAEGEKRPLDFAPYRLRHLEAQGAALVEYESISEAAARYFEAIETLGGHSALKAQVADALAELRGRDERKLSALRDEWQRAQGLETLRRKGELLLSYMHTLQPGQTRLTIPDENLTIALEPALTPVENSQAIFKEYRKARAAVEGLPERIAESELRVAYLDDLANSLDLARTYDEIKAVQAEVKTAGRSPTQIQAEANKQKARGKHKGRGPQAQEKLPQPLRLQTRNGIQMLVGRTAGQNDTATFRLAAPDDLWFHARPPVPGSHVILRAAPNLTDEDIEEAARVAAGRSRARQDAQVDVVYTEKKYVRKIPNAPPGQVTYKHERVIRVEPRK